MREQMIILLAWNVLVMFIYGIDKIKAKNGYRRISEKALLMSAFFLGGFGAIFGMVVFNHKTSKMKFRILVPLSAILCMMAVYFVNVIK